MSTLHNGPRYRVTCVMPISGLYSMAYLTTWHDVLDHVKRLIHVSRVPPNTIDVMAV